ncbi:Endonuclease/exonuclease/phosphatase [Purpureocillium lavendulum]|uniref:Endonuclease/exonuclease/phosphatase n=1 Tax=Purpureocillium lavendulum TaxID=1247861 RepID=A0AB34FD50_9HYPO|nr:Endonuclease/exonuclease/phosphatase [Purpureocillium lavendulum]
MPNTKQFDDIVFASVDVKYRLQDRVRIEQPWCPQHAFFIVFNDVKKSDDVWLKNCPMSHQRPASRFKSFMGALLNAVVSRGDGSAGFECWEMATPFKQYPTTGQAISGLAHVSNVSYVVLPPRSNEGIHKPPHPMFFALLSGQAHITLPRGKDELWVTAGVDGLIVANDVTGEGHVTEYPLDKPSVALQIPFRDGKTPPHRVVHEGPCPPQDADPESGKHEGL